MENANDFTVTFSANDEFHQRQDVMWNVKEDFIYTTVWWLRENLDPTKVEVKSFRPEGSSERYGTGIYYDGVLVLSVAPKDGWGWDYDLRYSKPLRGHIRHFLLENRAGR